MGQFTPNQTDKDIKKVSKNIDAIFARRKIAAFALASSFAIKALNLFRQEQSGNRFWVNRTQQALQRVFASGFQDIASIGFFIAHGVDYGVYLELANNRRHQALRPIARLMAIKFVKQLKVLYGKG